MRDGKIKRRKRADDGGFRLVGADAASGVTASRCGRCDAARSLSET